MLRRYGPQGDQLSIASGAFSLRQISWWYKQERDSGEPVCARDSREFERGRARLRGTNPFLARNVTHEVLSGKCRFGQSKGMSPGQAWVGGDMTN